MSKIVTLVAVLALTACGGGATNEAPPAAAEPAAVAPAPVDSAAPADSMAISHDSMAGDTTSH